MFNVLVYSSPVRGNLLVANWTEYVSGLRFASEAFGGFASCSFTLKRDFQTLFNYVEGTHAAPSYVSNRIIITEQERGRVVYQGKIHTLTLTYGTAVRGRSLDQLYNIARLGFTLRNYNTTVWSVYADTASQANYGTRVYRADLDGVYIDGTNPTNRATRFVVTHSAPSQPTAKVNGGAGDDLKLEVDCVGLSEELLNRFSENNRGTAQDTGEIVKDQLRAGAITSGVGAWRGQNGWYEMLHSSGAASGSIPYAVEGIETSLLGNIASSGVTISASEVHSRSRWDVIKAAAGYGSSSSKRMLFQVWEQTDLRTATGQNGKGLAYFAAQPTARSNDSSYTGYFDNSRSGFVFDKSGQRVPLHTVRAGQWITSMDVPAKNFGPVTSVFDDPRAFWIERAEYDADNYTLTLSSENDNNPDRYFANMLATRKIFRAEK